MLVTYNWLKDYVELSLPPEDLADKLTMAGLEVEELTNRYAYLDKVVTARIASINDHPNADTLKVCRVETGQAAFDVVCGAPNMKEGMVSALALVGAELPDGYIVREVDLRGVASVGMLCSEAELIIGPDASGIMELPADTPLGLGLHRALNLDDWVFELGITPNRPDCLCVIGVAREVAGLLKTGLKYPRFQLRESSDSIESQTSVEILDPKHCPRYVARIINNVTIGPSPFWMVEKLAGVGLRSINNVVDITNFVLMELGQPLHSFDLDRLEERRIVVRTASEGDRFTTLDGEERIMGPEMLMICDGKKPVALAGVMGGLNSEIVSSTTDVLLESAYFSPTSIRRTSKTLGLSTDASFRFERGIDPEGCLSAADRASALMAELAGGRVARGFIDRNPIRSKQVIVPFSPKKCNDFLGTAVKPEGMIEVLNGIGLEVEGQGEDLRVRIPSFRVDLTREVDLYEEAARLIGYDEIPVTVPLSKGELEQPDPMRLLRDEVRDILQGLGLSEILTYSFTWADFCDRLGLPEGDRLRRVVRILNPLSEDQALLRTTLVPGMLDVLRRNNSYQVMDVGLFEVGRVFFDRPGQELPEEREAAAGLISGRRHKLTWHEKPQPVDFYDIKGLVEELLDDLNVTGLSFSREGLPAYYDRSFAARVSSGGRTLGFLGLITDSAAGAFDLKQTPYVFELDLETVMACRGAGKTFSALPRFPSVSRDLAIILDQAVAAGEIEEYISGLQEEYLTEIVLFDAYEGQELQGRKNLAFRLLYRAPDKTLTDEEVNAIHRKVMDKVIVKFKAELKSLS